MKRVLITGSSDGLGLLSGKLLLEQGHRVVLHARNEERVLQIHQRASGAAAIVVGDLSTMAGMRSVADQANKLGRFDAVIHNVGLGDRETREITADAVTRLFAVNVLAPYVLTALIERPSRLIYLSSGSHLGGSSNLDDLQWQNRPWKSYQAYSDTKLHDQLLAMWLARKWKDTLVNAVDPGWVPTRMGGPGAPDDLQKGAESQAWLAVSDEPDALVSGKYIYHKRQQEMHPDATNREIQDRLVAALAKISGVKLAET